MNTKTNTSAYSAVAGGRAVPLCGEARLFAGLLAAGMAGPAPLLAALADTSSAVARRHLEHLVRLGAAVRTGQDYHPAPGRKAADPVVPDAVALARVADWYLSCAYRAAEVLGSVALPGGEQITADPERPAVILCGAVAAADWYRGARPRLLAVLDQTAADGEHARAWRLALLIAQVEIVTGPAAGWEEVLELGLSAARAAREPGSTAMLMDSQAKALLHQGRFDQARAVHTEALALREQDCDRLGVAASTNGLGLVAYRQGNLDAAREIFAHAVELAGAAGSDEFEAYARLNLGAVLDERGEPGQARVLLEQAASYLRDAGRDNYLADVLYHLASTYRAEGDYARALEVAREAVDAAVRFGLPMFWAGALCELAEAYLALGERDAALAALIEAHGIRSDLGDVVRAGAVEERIGAIGLAA